MRVLPWILCCVGALSFLTTWILATHYASDHKGDSLRPQNQYSLQQRRKADRQLSRCLSQEKQTLRGSQTPAAC